METRDLNDLYDLPRFAAAQDPGLDTVCAELAAGRKRSHWMWFVFPQVQAWAAATWRGATPYPAWTKPGLSAAPPCWRRG